MSIAFNESYYLQNNSDVLSAVTLGIFKSGADHFNKIGGRENRDPNAVFDSSYYAAANPDVAAAVSAGIFANAYDHYIKKGLTENRAPNASLVGFDGANYIATHADVAAAGFTAATALQHYVQYGIGENRSFTSSTAGAVTGNYAGTANDDTVTPAGGQANTVRVEGGQQGTAGDTLVITSGSASSFQSMNLGNNADQNETRDNTTGNNGGAKIGPVVQGFENIDARQATINMNLTALDRTSIGNTGSVASTQTGSVLQGGTGRDTLTGNSGNDSLVGGVGNDTLNGNVGNDTIFGGANDDSITGGLGNDTLSDEAGDDTVTGDAGTDTITVGAGRNSIDGGADNDTITLAADQATSTTVSTISGGDGNDTIVLNATAITAASRVSVSGGTGNDTITVGLGVETVNAGAGNDTIIVSNPSTTVGTNDAFNGNDGQDFIRLEIPSGSSGVSTYVFDTTTAAKFSGFEVIELKDSTGDTTAKQYKIVLTDAFVDANVAVNGGAFLIDARGLPGGSNVVIDFSQLTAASATDFATGGFRVLASVSTDIRDQNNVGITSAYTLNTGNPLLAATAAFQVYAGETDSKFFVGGTDSRTSAGLVNMGNSGQTAYTAALGTAETGSGGTTGQAFTLITGTTGLSASTNTGTDQAGTTNFLSSGANTITDNAGFLGAGDTINDGTTGDGDVMNITLLAAAGAAGQTVTNIETINITNGFGAGSVYNATSTTGTTTYGVSGNGGVTITNAGTGQTVNLNSSQALAINPLNDTGSDSLTLNLVGGLTAGASIDTNVATDYETLTINSNTSANILTLTDITGMGTVNTAGAAALELQMGDAASIALAAATLTDTSTGGLTLRHTAALSASRDFATKSTGVDRIVYAADNGGGETTTVDIGTTVEFASTQTGANTLTSLAAQMTGSADQINLVLSAAGNTAYGTPTVGAGIERVGINATGSSGRATVTDVDFVTQTTDDRVVITGSQDLTFTGMSEADVVDATGYVSTSTTQGALTLTSSAAMTINGSASVGGDSVAFGAVANTYNANGGYDLITEGGGTLVVRSNATATGNAVDMRGMDTGGDSFVYVGTLSNGTNINADSNTQLTTGNAFAIGANDTIISVVDTTTIADALIDNFQAATTVATKATAEAALIDAFVAIINATASRTNLTDGEKIIVSLADTTGNNQSAIYLVNGQTDGVWAASDIKLLGVTDAAFNAVADIGFAAS